MSTENNDIALGEPHNFPEELSENVLISRGQFEQLIALLSERNGDIINLVQVFQLFSGLFDSDAGIAKIITKLPKLMKDKQLQERLASVLPIIEKYTASPENSHE